MGNKEFEFYLKGEIPDMGIAEKHGDVIVKVTRDPNEDGDGCFHVPAECRNTSARGILFSIFRKYVELAGGDGAVNVSYQEQQNGAMSLTGTAVTLKPSGMGS